MDGYIKIYRSIIEWEHFTEANVLMVFMYLLVIANHKKRIWNGHECDKGETFASLRTIAEDCSISLNTAKKAVDILIKSGEIERKQVNRKTYKIIINNFSKFQSNGKYCVSKNKTQSNTQTDTQSNTQTDTKQEYNKNEKNIKKEKEKEKEKEKPLAQSFFDDEKMLQEILSVPPKVTEFCNVNHISVADCLRYAQAVYSDWQVTEMKHSTRTDALKHMFNGIRKKAEIERYQAKKNGKTREERERELANHMMQTLIEINNATNNIQ